MNWFTPKCPYCDGPLQKTGYSAPYPTHRCPTCIAANERKAEIEELTARVERLEQATPHKPDGE